MKTADDIEIRLGMTLWPEHETDNEEGGIVILGLRDNVSREVLLHGDTCDLTTCYATRRIKTANRPNETKSSPPEYGGATGSTDPFSGFPDDYPCRTCGDPNDFTHGLERCDDQPCEALIVWQRKQSNNLSHTSAAPADRVDSNVGQNN